LTVGRLPRLARSAWIGLGATAGSLAISSGRAPVVLVVAVASSAAGAGAVLSAVSSRLEWPAAGIGQLRRSASGGGRARTPGEAVRAATCLALGSLLLLGRAWISGDLAAHVAGPGSGVGPPIAPGSTGRRLATVISIGSPKAAEQIALIDLASLAERPGPATGTNPVEALLPRYPEVGPGDLIAVSGRVQPPGDDEYGAYLRQIGATGTLRSPILERLAGPDGPAGFLDAIRQGSDEALARALPEPQAGLASGILVGLRERVDRDLAAAFTTAGVSHIVAISGWNIAIVAAVVGALLGWAPPGPRVALSLVAILLYTLVAGASPSVDRAALMASIGLLARASGRTSSAIAALGWAVLFLLLLDPATVADPGFELSGLATAGLIAWAAPLTARLGAIRLGRRRAPGWLAESLAISLAAQASTLPIILLSFGRLSVVAPLANLVIVPLVPPAMAAGAVALAAGWLGAAGLPAPLVTALGLPGWALLGVIVGLVRFMAGLPLASVTLPPPWNVAGAAMAALFVAATATQRLPAFRGRVSALGRVPRIGPASSGR
jgi:competence protein ComEC